MSSREILKYRYVTLSAALPVNKLIRRIVVNTWELRQSVGQYWSLSSGYIYIIYVSFDSYAIYSNLFQMLNS